MVENETGPTNLFVVELQKMAVFVDILANEPVDCLGIMLSKDISAEDVKLDAVSVIQNRQHLDHLIKRLTEMGEEVWPSEQPLAAA